MEEEHMLTTIDNPFNPFTEFEDWYAFDEDKGYHTLSYIARIGSFSNDFTEEEESQALEDAIDEIVRLNTLGIYKKVTKDDPFYRN